MRALRAAAVSGALALLGCESVPGAPAPFPAAMSAVLDQANAPGIIAGIYRDGALSEVFAWGGAECFGAGEVDSAAGYEIGSISKHIAAIAVVQLWERGLIDLDAAISTYVAETPSAWAAVTVRQLLNHTSGVPDYEAASGYQIYETTPTATEVLAVVGELPLEFEPATQFAYSNTGYYLLSLAVERVSGASFGDYLHDNVFAPLHLSETYLSEYGDGAAPRAQGCRPNEDGQSWLPVRPISASSTLGAGGVITTLDDWAAWDAAIGRRALLSERGWAQMFSRPTLASGEISRYAFGLTLDDYRGALRISHSGQTRGFTSSYMRFPEHGVGILVMANSYGASTGEVARALAPRAIPSLSYHAIAAIEDVDAAQVERSRRALRQSVLGEAPLDLLGAGMQAFATEDGFAPMRASLSDKVARLERLEPLRVETTPSGVSRHLYRAYAGGEVLYFTMAWRGGVLIGLNWEDE